MPHELFTATAPIKKVYRYEWPDAPTDTLYPTAKFIPTSTASGNFEQDAQGWFIWIGEELNF